MNNEQTSLLKRITLSPISPQVGHKKSLSALQSPRTKREKSPNITIKQANLCKSPLDPTFFQLHTKSGKQDYKDFRIESNQKEIRKEIEDENPNRDDEEIFSCDL
jgi:hypothetical protein